ncbi:MAG TPA: zinc-dependent alcohol dehydrogenase [Blastocatellia bacterium]|nr:zinc-dependent alcohol dehydrogenase [Blastocatellia bacterium]
MKAAVLREFKKRLTVEDIQSPSPEAGEVVIEVEACGVCHSDLHLAEGDWPQLYKIVKLPLVLGHEVVGRVVERGAGVHDLEKGERVGVAWIHWTCGECEHCREGNENLCTRQSITGAMVDGGFARFIKAPASHAVRVPDGLSSIEAAPLFCAGVTVYRAIKKSGIGPGMRVGVFGIGGLGHLAVQIARERGAQITAVDVSDDKLEFAKSLGAATTLNATQVDVTKAFRAAGGLHAAIVTSAAKQAYDTAFYSLRRGGTLMVVGVPAEPLSFPPILMVGSEIRIISSAVGTREDLKEVLELAAAGKLKCKTEARPIEQINAVFDEMRAGRITGRIVLIP